jgi:hypothetical protein
MKRCIELNIKLCDDCNNSNKDKDCAINRWINYFKSIGNETILTHSTFQMIAYDLKHNCWAVSALKQYDQKLFDKFMKLLILI